MCICFVHISFKQTPVISKEKGKSKKKKVDGKQKNDKKKEANEGWVVFCDFHEITHAVIKEATVTIYRQDNKRMVDIQANQRALCFLWNQPPYFHLYPNLFNPPAVTSHVYFDQWIVVVIYNMRA